jgi:hypothetical protein
VHVHATFFFGTIYLYILKHALLNLGIKDKFNSINGIHKSGIKDILLILIYFALNMLPSS